MGQGAARWVIGVGGGGEGREICEGKGVVTHVRMGRQCLAGHRATITLAAENEATFETNEKQIRLDSSLEGGQAWGAIVGLPMGQGAARWVKGWHHVQGLWGGKGLLSGNAYKQSSAWRAWPVLHHVCLWRRSLTFAPLFILPLLLPNPHPFPFKHPVQVGTSSAVPWPARLLGPRWTSTRGERTSSSHTTTTNWHRQRHTSTQSECVGGGGLGAQRVEML